MAIHDFTLLNTLKVSIVSHPNLKGSDRAAARLLLPIGLRHETGTSYGSLAAMAALWGRGTAPSWEGVDISHDFTTLVDESDGGIPQVREMLDSLGERVQRPLTEEGIRSVWDWAMDSADAARELVPARLANTAHAAFFENHTGLDKPWPCAPRHWGQVAPPSDHTVRRYGHYLSPFTARLVIATDLPRELVISAVKESGLAAWRSSYRTRIPPKYSPKPFGGARRILCRETNSPVTDAEGNPASIVGITFLAPPASHVATGAAELLARYPVPVNVDFYAHPDHSVLVLWCFVDPAATRGGVTTAQELTKVVFGVKGRHRDDWLAAAKELLGEDMARAKCHPDDLALVVARSRLWRDGGGELGETLKWHKDTCHQRVASLMGSNPLPRGFSIGPGIDAEAVTFTIANATR